MMRVVQLPPCIQPCISSPTHMEANVSSLHAFCLQDLPPSSPPVTYHFPSHLHMRLHSPRTFQNFSSFLVFCLTLNFLFSAHSDVFSSRNTFYNQCQHIPTHRLPLLSMPLLSPTVHSAFFRFCINHISIMCNIYGHASSEQHADRKYVSFSTACNREYLYK